MIQKIVGELQTWLATIVGGVPGVTGARLRAAYYRRRLGRVGRQPGFGAGIAVNGAQDISIGDAFGCMRNCYLDAGGGGQVHIGHHVNLNMNVFLSASEGGRLTIGDDVRIGPNVVVRASGHRFDDLNTPIRLQGHHATSIVIEDDVWLGANVVVLGGVRIGRGSVVAAGAVVTRDVPARVVVGGVPARVLRMRGGEPVTGEFQQ